MKKYNKVEEFEKKLKKPIKELSAFAVMDRLDEVFGVDGWTARYSPWMEGQGGTWALSVICEIEAFVYLPEGPTGDKSGLHKVSKRGVSGYKGPYEFCINTTYEQSLIEAAHQLGIGRDNVR